MKKILVTANLDLFFTKFLIPHLKYLKDRGYEVHVACRDTGVTIPYCDKRYDVSFARSLNIKDNKKSLKQMKQILKKNNYDIIHCHTPFGAAITRIACKLTNCKAKIIYTAHGFHFFKGASIKNWLVFYPVEKMLARWTDCVITMNEEDYNIAKNKFKSHVYYIPGIGLDEKKFKNKISKTEKTRLRNSLGLNQNDFVIIYAAELLKRKGQTWLLSTLQPLLIKNSNIKLILAGNDSLHGTCQQLAKELHIEQQVLFLGFRNDISKLLQIANMAVSSSYQEGLPVNLMEAIYYHLPLVVTDCRGNKDFVKTGVNGYLIQGHNPNDFREKVEKIYHHVDLDKVSEYDKNFINKFYLNNVLKEMDAIYKEVERTYE